MRRVAKILITGIAGGIGRLVAERLHGEHEVIGIDRSPWRDAPPSIRVHRLDLRKRQFEDIVRTEQPDTIIHMAFVRHFRGDPAVRHEVNVQGTRRLLEHAAAYDVGKVVVVSSAYVYGALADNPRYVAEDHPLNVSRNFPELRDLAEVEGVVGAFLWRYPDIATSILRPVNTLGRDTNSAVGRYLDLDIVPTVMGFNPMMQFIHEQDLADAVCLAVEKGLRGIFNVAGPSAVPLHTAIAEIGRRHLPLLDPVAHAIIAGLFRLNIYGFPAGALDFIKYSCTVCDDPFREATGFVPRKMLAEIFASIRRK
ncbi:MAG: UDP-glucose 4-epimerase [Hyphomicrobiaceae bacterium]